MSTSQVCMVCGKKKPRRLSAWYPDAVIQKDVKHRNGTVTHYQKSVGRIICQECNQHYTFDATGKVIEVA